jgi:hypothetical protein
MSTNPTTTLDAPEISTIEPPSNRAMPGQRHSGRSFRSRSIAVTVAALVLSIVALVAGPVMSASALTQITLPANYSCGNAQISVSPPKAWANPGRTEQVTWINQVERYNASTGAWYVYATYINYGSFNQFGSNVTSWSMGNTNRGGMYINSRLNLPVYHQGYYRVAAMVGNQTMSSLDYVGGISYYCWMP